MTAKSKLGAFFLFVILCYSAYYYWSNTQYNFIIETKIFAENQEIILKTVEKCEYISSGEIFHTKTTLYRNLPYSIGKKFPSGRGVYMLVPNLCGLIQMQNRPPTWPIHMRNGLENIIPIIYVSDNYESPTEYRFNIAPGTYRYETDGFEIRHSFARSIGRFAALKYQKADADMRVPWVKYNAPSRYGFVFYPVPSNILLPGEKPLMEEGRYQLFTRYSKPLPFVLGYNPYEYRRYLAEGDPKDVALRKFVKRETYFRAKQPAKYFSIKGRSPERTIREDMSKIISLRVAKDGQLLLAKNEDGILYNYGGDQNLQSKIIRTGRYYEIKVGKRVQRYKLNKGGIAGARLYDRTTGQLYILMQLKFSS